MVNRKRLRKKIPYGAISEIAEKAGVSRTAVANYFSGKYKSSKVENAALQLVADIQNQKKSLLNQMK
jgi:AcrR family transcriptional regulator